jgi:hypothetical protein
MPDIYPKMTRRKLKEGARKTARGKGRVALPGVKTDAGHAQATDTFGYAANRELAQMIRKALRAKKKADKNGDRFVLGWRLYPNEAHPDWKNNDVHSCGCGCGCSA